MLERFLFPADEVVPQIGLELRALLPELRKVYEESRAHVSLESFYFVRPCRPIALREESAVFEQTAAANLFRLPCCDELLGQMVQGLVEVSVYGFPYDGRIEVLADRELSAFVEREQRI